MKNLCMIFTIVLVTNACQTGFVPISQRNLYEKEGKSAHLGHRRPIEEGAGSNPDVYIKKQHTAVVPQETKNYTGSLFTLNNPDNLLFIRPPRGEVGDFLDIGIEINRKDKPPEVAPTAQADNPASNPNSAQGQADKSKSLQDDLVAALPKLEPDSSEPKIPTSLKMRVVRKFENGDVVVEAYRASQNEWEAHAIRIQAKIPREKLQGENPITTADLEDVNWYQSDNGVVVERESSLWEDEYSIRWAGFTEARSKMALDLEAKRKDLDKVKERLRDRIVSVGKERNKIAQEKERVAIFRKDAEDKLNELTKKVDDQDDMIAQQKEVIKKQEKLIENMQIEAEKAKQEEPKVEKDAAAKSKSKEENAE